MRQSRWSSEERTSFRQTMISACGINQFTGRIDPKLVEQSCRQISGRDWIARRIGPDAITGPDNGSSRSTTTGQQGGEDIGPVVTAGLVAIQSRRSPKLADGNHQR